jgi:hypothetical protein
MPLGPGFTVPGPGRAERLALLEEHDQRVDKQIARLRADTRNWAGHDPRLASSRQSRTVR